MILRTTPTQIFMMCLAWSGIFTGWAYGDDFTDTLDNAKASYKAGEVKDTRLFVQDLLKILDDQEALLITQCVNEGFSPKWKAEEANIQTGDGGGLGKGGVSLEQRFTTEEGKSRGARATGAGGAGAKSEILQTQGYVTLKIQKGGPNLENMLGGLGKLLGAQDTRKGRFIKIGENRGNIEFKERNFSGKVNFKVGQEMDVELKGRHISKKQLLEVTENALDFPCLSNLSK